MKVLFDPFRLFGRLCLLSFRLICYTFIFIIQIIGYVRFRRKDKIVDAFGDFGRSSTDAFAETLKD